jgi:transglutaminase-like putative cysteine protease
MAWPADDALELPHGLSADASRIALHVTVVTPVLRSAVQPYVTRSILSTQFQGYSMSPMGDIFPHPPIARGTSYRMEFSSLDDGPGIAGDPGPETDPRFLALPPPAALGIDLRTLARPIFKEAGDVDSRIEMLRAYFASTGFRYSNRASWRGKDPVARFIRDEKIGSCAYFATATALLLRAGGVRSRIAAGFLGGTWDAARGQAVLRNRDAHAWVEVFLPRAGWRPIDPTAWVPLDASYVPPPDVPPSASGQPFESMAQRPESGWADRALDAENESRAAPAEDPGKERAWTLQDSAMAPSSGQRENFADELEEAAALQSWIEYREAVGGEAIDLATGSSPAGDGGETGESATRLPLKPRLMPRAPSPYNVLPRPEGPGTRLRVAIILLGGAVLSLLVLMLLRPKRKVEDGEEGEAALDGIDEIGAVLPANGIFLDEADPRDRVLADYLRLQESLERTRSHRRPHQTPVEHGRLVARRRKGLEAAFRELHGILYRLVYGGGHIEEKHAERATWCCRRIKRYLG